MEYNFRDIEKKWQEKWKEQKAYEVSNNSVRPKYYVLDMFPYPSGTGLHVGHPLGYIASDIFARYKRLQGFNVLHPMGYDAFGLPAEQYAIDHGIHPAVSTDQNISNFRKQLDNIGFSFDWSREVRTSDPKFYKWTQWIFLKLFESWYNRSTKKAESISTLEAIFEKEGNLKIGRTQSAAGGNESGSIDFSADQWKSFDEKQRQDILMNYRLAFCGYGEVNWCEALGTVLANDEVINGVSERGGYPVVKKKLRQWYLRITEYADRLLEGLDTVEFSDSMKEMQTNWIGKSYGAEIDFHLTPNPSPSGDSFLRVYTTRPDTIFGVDFMVIAPEHELVEKITSAEQQKEVEGYLSYVKSRSERERMAEKKISGVFTGTYAENPFDGRKIPVWISEYVLAGYGTGAIMGVPCGDERDHKFARHFKIPITNIIGKHYDGVEANPTKDAILENSGFLNGMIMRDAIEVVLQKLESMKIGQRKVNYKMRDAAFSRQRYWGEPFPIVWKDGIAEPLPESELPVLLPHLDELKPGPDAEGPLANLDSWKHYKGGIREVNTMPGYAGSSWYFLRYMDPHNENEFCDRQASDYWNQVDLYIGGTEHAVGHLLYSRMWTKVLFDLDFIGYDEPYRKLVNQGMIQGSSRFVYRFDYKLNDGVNLNAENPVLISHPIVEKFKENEKGLAEFIVSKVDQFNSQDASKIFASSAITGLHIDVNLVSGLELDLAGLRNWRTEYENAYFIMDDGSVVKPGESSTSTYTCGAEVEKMSKRYYNVVNPDDIVMKYGADTYRMYEMFLGPVEQSKPWETQGIEGVHRFIKKLWRLFYDDMKGKVWNEEKASEAELKILHKSIKKIGEDTERFSFNTGVSGFMIFVNELSDIKCSKKEILEPLLILLTPYAPHVAEELWHLLGNSTSILDATYPKANEKFLVETSKNYPVSINGKVRTQIDITLDASQQEVEQIILDNEIIKKWLNGGAPKKIIYVKNKMINVVL
ncbi:MAG: leucine--tRNA ligase [Bacteroidetes bacterium]|nr:MAG: leucine--tRNA ligase [Bacteroidota bacterium]